ncbi:MAG: hypothetical protein KIT57_09250 [Blastocatellales bacterium]|nr:hypothetical protein [Blastocatellales bacterium]
MKDNNPAGPNRFYRAIAIFFLLFTVFDLSLPSLCQEDFQEIRIAAHSEQPESAAPPLPSHRPGDEPGSDTEEHDCFCCCTHLTPVDMMRVADISYSLETIPWGVISLPFAPPPGTDHPPRLA